MEARKRTRTEAALWNLAYLEVSEQEARKRLGEDQYSHLVQQFEMLAEMQQPLRSPMHDIRPIDQFYELREKGGLFGKLNVRVFFFVHKITICVLGFYKKKEEGQTPPYIVAKMRNRMRCAKGALEGNGNRG